MGVYTLLSFIMDGPSALLSALLGAHACCARLLCPLQALLLRRRRCRCKRCCAGTSWPAVPSSHSGTHPLSHVYVPVARLQGCAAL